MQRVCEKHWDGEEISEFVLKENALEPFNAQMLQQRDADILPEI